MSDKLIHECVCGGKQFYDYGSMNSIPMVECTACGVRHQYLEMSESDLMNYYKTKYHRESYTHSFEHDREVARARLDCYGVDFSTPALDVGCGNGAFIKEAHALGEVYGTELSTDSMRGTPEQEEMYDARVYTGEMKDIKFPTDYFKSVTCHDVFEHALKPKELLEEMFRCLGQGGYLFLEIPDFYSPHGRHHWKRVEHIWYVTIEQTIDLLTEVGFVVQTVGNPIPGKVLIKSYKPAQDRVKILVPPGIGDSYWSFVKMQSFLEAHKLGIPDVYISNPDNKPRAHGFAQMLPFINAAGYCKHGMDLPEFKEAYFEDKRCVFHSVAGMDYFIAFNGAMRWGKSLEETYPQYRTNWHLPTFRSKAQDQYAEDVKKDFGKFIIAYFVPHGMYKQWLREFKPSQIIDALRRIQERTGNAIVMTGARWDIGTDLHRAVINSGLNIIDLTGKTSLEQFMGLARASNGIIGFPSGTTIVPTMFNVPTVLLWNDYFNSNFWKYSCSPHLSERAYVYLDTKTVTPELLANTACEVFHDN